MEVALDAEAQAIASKAGHDVANVLMVADLLRAIEQNRKPCCSEKDGRWTIEMVQGVYQAQQDGNRVAFPLQSRRHPLDG